MHANEFLCKNVQNKITLWWVWMTSMDVNITVLYQEIVTLHDNSMQHLSRSSVSLDLAVLLSVSEASYYCKHVTFD